MSAAVKPWEERMNESGKRECESLAIDLMQAEITEWRALAAGMAAAPVVQWRDYKSGIWHDTTQDHADLISGNPVFVIRKLYAAPPPCPECQAREAAATDVSVIGYGYIAPAGDVDTAALRALAIAATPGNHGGAREAYRIAITPAAVLRLLDIIDGGRVQRHVMVDTINRLRMQADRARIAQSAPAVAATGVLDSHCDYMAPRGWVCSKCGKVHASPTPPAPPAPDAQAIRNAALEEAAALFPQRYMEYFGDHIQDEIRALKSTPPKEPQ